MSCFCVSVLQVNLPKQNFIQARPYADSIVIAVCRCLSFCCTRRSCQTFQKNQVAGYARHGNSSTFAMKTSCLLCDVPIRQVVDFASVLVTTVGDERRFWVARWPTQSLYVANWSHHNRVHRGFRFLSHQQWQVRQELLHTFQTPTKAIGQSMIGVETGFLSRRRCHGKLLSEISFHVLCEHRSQIHTMSWCVCRSFAWFVRRIACTRVSPMLFIHAICWFCQRFASRMLSHCTRVWNHQFASSTRLEWYRFRLEKSTRKVPWYVFSLPKFRRSAAIRWYHLLGALTKPYIAVNEWTQWWCSNCNFRDHSGICSQNVSEIGCAESILKLLVIVFDVHNLFVQTILKNTHTSRFVYEYEKQVKQ